MKRIVLLVLASCCIGCHSYRPLTATLHSQLNQYPFDQQFSGLVVYDPVSKDTLINMDGHRYFTPASNTKILTLYTALNLLPKRLPSFQYSVENGQTYIRALGNPTNMHPKLMDSSLVHFAKAQHHIQLYIDPSTDAAFGHGWAWEDYEASYMPERSVLPFYGNVLRLQLSDSLYYSIPLFKDSITIASHPYKRELHRNKFYIAPTKKDTLTVPFISSAQLSKQLLQSLSGTPIELTETFPTTNTHTIYGISADSLYREMMLESDNFLAEQLLILASYNLDGPLSSTTSRQYILHNQLAQMPDPPKWVDGSGLSRYNLVTPASMVFVLEKLYQQLPKKRLYSLFPTGGESGTLKHLFKDTSKPYIYAKTGSLANNYCLSGYLETRSGKTLIFSFMNNHFMENSTVIKNQMQQLLAYIRDHY